jgi:hypothetical protein
MMPTIDGRDVVLIRKAAPHVRPDGAASWYQDGSNRLAVADSSEVLDRAPMVFRVVRMNPRAAARTFRLHNQTHGRTFLVKSLFA